MKTNTDIRLERKFDGSNVWFTSDTHFSHANIMKFCNRPFDTAQQMNEALIKNWNETVPVDGIVFHLGDFCYGGSAEWTNIISRLNGKIYLVLGNHDMRNIRQGYMDKFEAVMQQMTIRVNDQTIILNHNPFLCYGGSYRDVWQLFGHVHSGPMSNTGLDIPRLKTLFPLQYDVGVDNNDYRPVSFAQVKAKIEAQQEEARLSVCRQELRNDELRNKLVFIDPVTCFRNAGTDGPFPQECRDALSRIIDKTDAAIVITGPWAELGLDECCRIWDRNGLPGYVYGIATGEPDVKSRILKWLSSVGRGFRYVYLGDEPLEDFRTLTISPSTGIISEDAEKAIDILGKIG